jgi:hypothetical protein
MRRLSLVLVFSAGCALVHERASDAATPVVDAGDTGCGPLPRGGTGLACDDDHDCGAGTRCCVRDVVAYVVTTCSASCNAPSRASPRRSQRSAMSVTLPLNNVAPSN